MLTFPNLRYKRGRGSAEAFEGMEEASVAWGEEISERWGSSTNWIVTEGSLQGSISFETSVDDGPTVIPDGVLLLTPTPEEDSTPCEITVSFKDKHEIHSVYIRSTARIYEIYYAYDQQNKSKEYLCTVRCGATAVEGTPPSITEGVPTESQNRTMRTMKTPEQSVQGDSNSSDEDGWVDVKVPVSDKRDDQVNALSKRVVESTGTKQVYYEATAEISDASPCVSITVRLLSLHTKTCAHIEEIYIYADPVESNGPNFHRSVGENSGGTSLLAMLVPNLLQLSKSGARRVHESCTSDVSGKQKSQHGACEAAETRSPGTVSTMLQEAYFTIPDEKSRLVQEPSEVQIQLENTHLGHIQKETASHQAPESVIAENNPTYSRVEKVLDELVSKVARIEAFCSRFEENMMKPLGYIETRLQRLEQQLDAFVVRTQSSERIPFPSRISASKLSCHEPDSENKDCNTSYRDREDAAFHDPSSPADDVAASVLESDMCTGLVAKESDFLNEYDEFTNSSDTSDLVVMDCPNDNQSMPIDGAFASVPEPHMCPGLSIKAPEFLNEDDECTSSDDTLDLLVEDKPGTKKPLSIDSALASALAAFMTSTAIKSPNHSPCLMGVPHEASNGTNSDLASSTVRTPSEGAESILSKSDLENNGCDMMDPGTDFGEPLSLADDVAAPKNLFDESGIENKDCNVSDAVKEGTAIDDSSFLADDLTSPVFASQTRSNLIVIAPEFPVGDGDFVGRDDTSDFYGRDYPEDQAESPNDGGPASALAVFLSSITVKSSNCCPILRDCSFELSSGDNYDLAAASSNSEGADRSGNKNPGNDVIGNVDLDMIFKSWPSKGSLEQNDKDRIVNKCSSFGAPLDGSNPNCRPLEDRLEQEDHGMNLCKRNLLHCSGTGLNVSINHNWRDGGCADDDDDSEEAVHGDPSSNQHGRGWAEDSSSTGSSFDEDLIDNKVHIEWSDGSSTDSYWGPYTVNQSNGRAAADCRTQFPVESTVSHCDIATVGYGYEKSKAEIEQALHCAWDYQDPAPEVPLEVLLGATGSVDDAEDRSGPTAAADQLLLEVEGGDVVGTGDPGSSSSQQQFSSLI